MNLTKKKISRNAGKLLRTPSKKRERVRERELNWVGLVFQRKKLFRNYQRHNLTIFLKLRDSRHKLWRIFFLVRKIYFLHYERAVRSPDPCSVCRAWGASPERVESCSANSCSWFGSRAVQGWNLLGSSKMVRRTWFGVFAETSSGLLMLRLNTREPGSPNESRRPERARFVLAFARVDLASVRRA